PTTSPTPKVFAAENHTIQIALVGCGGRGTGGLQDALRSTGGPLKVVALADVFQHKVENTLAMLKKRQGEDSEQHDVPKERQFVGMDAYKQAMDALNPGDVVSLTTPPAFRWLHYKYAIEKGLNVFMEKPVTVDAPTSKRMLEINQSAIAKNLKVAVGLMCRHCVARQQMVDQIRDGAIGDITTLRAYRMAGPTGSAATPPKPEGRSDLHHQIRHFHGFLWLSGGAVSDFLIHNIDECCWIKDAWPVSAIGSGGRHYRGDDIDQNFDTYSIEYTFADGARMFVEGRTIPGCYRQFASYAHGTKGSAIISTSSHTPAKPRLFSDHQMDKSAQIWNFEGREPNPYVQEWSDFLHAVRNDQPYNEVQRGVMASAVTSMGRMAAHTGQSITMEQFMQHEHEFAPGLADLTIDGPAPILPDEDGKYSVPMPGLVKKREYL
ncbi:MAG: Gfo/Idh/MocA family oxidoreductase, partial [Planctomycetota bacterium]